MGTDRAHTASPTIWVVDDDEDVALHLGMMLRRADVAVELRALPDIASLRDALARGDAAPALVLLDHVLPTGLGSELVPEVRAAHPKTTIRLITAAPDEIPEAHATIGVIEKPLTVDAIIELLSS